MKFLKNSLPLILLILVACDQEYQEPERPELNGKTAIRVKNTSGHFYNDVVVSAGTDTHEYNTVAPLTSSEYKLFEFAYRYAFVELTIDGDLATIQPIDFLGETELDPGYYTYEISTNDNRGRYGRLSLKLVED